MSSYKSTAVVFAFIAVAVINIQSLLFPIFASYEGQWARVQKGGMFGWGDEAFYPQSLLFPFDIALYLAIITMLSLMAFKWLAKMQSRMLLKMYLVVATPVLMVVVKKIRNREKKKLLKKEGLQYSREWKAIVDFLATKIAYSSCLQI